MPDGHPEELAEQFVGLLWGDLMISLMLLRVVKQRNPREIEQQAAAAAAVLFTLQAAT